MADIKNNEPVAYFYELTGVGKELVLDCNGEYARKLLEAGYTETPLYTRAAPPAMDREAVARIIIGPRNPVPVSSRLSLRELQDIRWAQVTKQEQREALWIVDAILSTLSADAIRQGEGDIERAAKVADHYADEAETHADMTDLGARVEMNWHVRAEALRDIAKRIRALATPASHASDGGK